MLRQQQLFIPTESSSELIIVSIVDTTEKYLSNVDRKLDKKITRTSSINSSSTLFYCSIFAIYNRVHLDKKELLVLNSYIPGINT